MINIGEILKNDLRTLENKHLKSDLAAAVPKLVLSEFSLKNNHYVIFENNQYIYFPIKIYPDIGKPILRFERTPPILKEGVALFGGKKYEVTYDDLVRRIVRKSREIIDEVEDGTDVAKSSTKRSRKTSGSNGKNISEAGSASGNGEANENIKQRVFSESDLLEEHKAINNAWQEQIGTLLDLEIEEEDEWEVEDLA